MRRLPPLTAIEAFVQVARLGSVKAAAEALSLSSPALSRRVQALERHLGQQLFERRHQAMLPTAAGEQLHQRLAPAIDAVADAIDTVTGSGELLRLRLATPPLFASQWLIPRLGTLRRTHPELHLDIDTQPHALARLGEGMDAAIVLTREVDPALHTRRITRNRIAPIAGRELVDGPASLRRPEDIARTTVILHRDMPELFDHWRERSGLPESLAPAAIDHYDSGQLMLDAAAAGLGVAFMLDFHLADANDDRLVAPFGLDVESSYSYWFATRRSARASRAVKLFSDWMLAEVADV